MYKKLISAVCAVALTFSMAVSPPLVESVFVVPFAVSASAAGEYAYEEQALEMREHLRNFDESFSEVFMLPERPDDLNAFVDELLNEAACHSGVPTEGDWLRLHIYSLNCSCSIAKLSSNEFKLTLKFKLVYNCNIGQAELADEKADRILEYLDLSGKTDIEKITEIYNYICQNVEYDYDRKSDSSTELEHSAYAALCQGKAVCQGYALSVYDLMLKAGIDCRIVTGTLNGGAHAWNMVKLDGKWYQLDATNDRTRSSYKYFLVPLSDMPTHAADEDFTSEEFLSRYPMADSAADVSRDSLTKVSDGFVHTPSLDRISILSYSGTEKNVVVPAELDGVPVKSVASYCFDGNNTVESIVFSEGIEEIKGVFARNCASLKSISLPSTVQLPYASGENTMLIGFGGLTQRCGKLSDITVSEDSPYLTVEDGVLYSKDKTILVAYPTAKTDKSFAVPDTVKRINDEAFELNPYLETIALPDSVTDIGFMAMLGCRSLSNINVPKDCTSIGDYALYSFSRDLKIYFPKDFSGPLETKYLTTSTDYSSITFVCDEDSYAASFAKENGIKTQKPDADEHIYVIKVVEPTCTEKGYTIHTCTICGDTYTDSETDPKGHTYKDVVTEPTCTENGYTTHTCINCGDSYVDSETKAKGHTFSEWTTRTEPTTETEGEAYRTCSCGFEETKPIDKLTPSSSEPEDSSSKADTSSEVEDSSSKADTSSKVEDSSSKAETSSKVEDSSSKAETSSEVEESSSKADTSSEVEESSSKAETSSEVEESSSKAETSSKADDSSSKADTSSKVEDSSSKAETSSKVEESSSKADSSSMADDSSSKSGSSSKADVSSKPDSKEERFIGDVDGDGLLDIADAVTIIGYINGNGMLTPEQLKYADVDGVDGVDIADAVAIIAHINGVKALF